MPVNINGVSKGTEVDTSDLSSSDVSSMLKYVGELIDELKKASNFKNASKNQKDFEKQITSLLKQQEELVELQKSSQKVMKSSEFLTPAQKEKYEREFQQELLTQFKNIQKTSEDMDSMSLLMTGKLKVGQNFQKTLSSMNKFIEMTEKTASLRLGAERTAKEWQDRIHEEEKRKLDEIQAYNESISESRKSLVGSLTSWGKSQGGALASNMFNILGPFGGIAQTISKGLWDNRGAFKKKAKAPNKSSLLKDGGNVGVAAVYTTESIVDAVEDSSEKSEGIVSKVKDGLTSALGLGAGATLSSTLSSALSGISISGLGSTIGTAISTALPWALGAEALATFALGFYKGFSDEWKADLQSVTLNVNNLTKEDLDANEDGKVGGQEAVTRVQEEVDKKYAETWNPLNWILHPILTGNTLGAAIGQGYEEEGIWGAVKGFFTSMFTYNDILQEQTTAALEANSPETLTSNDELGILYRLLNLSGRFSEAEKLKNRYYNDETLADKYLGGTPDSHRVLGLDFYRSEAVSRLDYLQQNPYAMGQELQALSTKYAEYLNDAIIYKDNSVYVPHPDDNIILTKDDVSTPALTADFETTLFNVLNKIAEGSKGGTVVNNFSSNSSFDFSALRI